MYKITSNGFLSPTIFSNFYVNLSGFFIAWTWLTRCWIVTLWRILYPREAIHIKDQLINYKNDQCFQAVDNSHKYTSVSFTWVESWLKKSISVSAMLMIQRVVRGGEIFSSGFLHSCLTSLHFWYLMIFFFCEDDGEEEMKREEAERLKSECFGWGGAVSKRQSLDCCSNFQHSCVCRYKLTAFFKLL